MIVTCEQCQTRFKLDAARIPETGARVRCSRCKHAFFVVKPGAAARDAAVHALAGEAAASGSVPSPTATQDLGTLDAGPPTGNTSATRLMPPLGASAPQPEGSEGAEAPTELESDWQFNEPLRGDGGATMSREPRRPVARRAPPPPADEGVSLDALGTPDSWDILGDAALPPLESIATGASAKGPEAPARAGDAPRSGATSPKAVEAAPESGAATRPPESAWLQGRRDVAFFAGVWLWIAAVACIALAPRSPAAGAAQAVATLPGVSVEGLRGRFLENAIAGPIFVVSGELRVADPAARTGRLEVVLIGPSGEVARAPLGDAPPIERLRETAPAALEREIGESELARGARQLAAGQTLPVAALLPGAPRDVTGFRVEAAQAAEAAARPGSDAGQEGR